MRAATAKGNATCQRSRLRRAREDISLGRAGRASLTHTSSGPHEKTMPFAFADVTQTTELTPTMITTSLRRVISCFSAFKIFNQNKGSRRPPR